VHGKLRERELCYLHSYQWVTIPDGVIGALGSTQSLTKMSTRNFSWEGGGG
jgi:hypothetical protein